MLTSAVNITLEVVTVGHFTERAIIEMIKRRGGCAHGVQSPIQFCGGPQAGGFDQRGAVLWLNIRTTKPVFETPVDRIPSCKNTLPLDRKRRHRPLVLPIFRPRIHNTTDESNEDG